MKAVKLVLALAIGAICLWLAFRGVVDTERETGIPWDAIKAVILQTRAWGPLAFVALFALQALLRTERWRVQVRGLVGSAPGMRESFAINSVAAAAVFLLPFRLGEFVRPNLLAQRGIMRSSAGLAATAIERAVDGLVTTGFFGVILLLAHARSISLPGYVKVGGWSALALFGGAMIFFFVAFRWRAATSLAVERAVAVVHGPLAGRIALMVRGFLDGLACFRSTGDVLTYLGLTVVYWLLNAGSMYVLMLAMGVDADPLAPFFCLCFLVIGMMIPAPPGNVGTFHMFARLSLTVFGVSMVVAVAYAIMLHALTVLSAVLLAGAAFASGDVSLARVRQAAHEDGERPPSVTA